MISRTGSTCKYVSTETALWLWAVSSRSLVRLILSIWSLARLLFGVLIHLSLIVQTIVGSRANVTITRRFDAKSVANWEFVIAAASCPRALFADMDYFSISFVSVIVPFSCPDNSTLTHSRR